MTRPLGWLVAACLLAAYLLKPGPDTDATVKRLEAQREAREIVIAALAGRIAAVDTQYRAARPVYLAAVQGWDSIKVTLGERAKIDPVVLAGDKVVNACKEIDRTCEERVAVRDTLLAQKDTLLAEGDSLLTEAKRQHPARLLLFAEPGVAAHTAPPIGVRFTGEAGLALRLDRDLYLQLSANTDEEARLTIRRQLTLFR